MTDAIEHRGPDSAGQMIRPGRVALGFRRLSIIDLATGDQPLANENETVHATCNGEIYNFRTLRAELQQRGHRFRTQSDSEVIVHLYEEHGTDFVHHLQGMYAIALWDDTEQRLVLVRDRMGVKPLYWAPVSGGLLYGSEPRAIHASGVVPPAPDEAAIRSYLSLQYVPPPRSGYRGIQKLAPAERLVYEKGRVRVEPYWSLDFAPEPMEHEDAVRELDELLGAAVRSRLVADVPLGAFLSGGVDSSLVVSYMAEAEAQVKTFSIDFAEDTFSEGHHAQAVAQAFGTDHQSAVLAPDIEPLVAGAVHHAGEPFADSSAIPTLLLSKFTRTAVTVALSGDGGDEAFGGYRRYALASNAERLAGTRHLAAAAEKIGIGRLAPIRRSQVGRAIDALARPADQRYARIMSHFEPSDVDVLCTPEFRALAGPDDAWRHTLALDERLGRVNRYLALDTTTYLPGDLLLKVDRMSMAHALEVRSPLLDYRVFEFAARLPERYKLRRGHTKWLLKEVARRRGVPVDVIDRPKQGFGVPVGTWMRGPLRGWVEGLLLDPASRSRGWFEPAAVERLVADHVAGVHDHWTRLWNLAMLESWLRDAVDG